MNSKTKQWLSILLMPHILTALLLGPGMLIYFMGGIFGVYLIFPYLGQGRYFDNLIYIGLPIVFITLILGFVLRNKLIGRRLVSLAIYLWFVIGFLCLSAHY
ncbi:hypothetical protein NEISICOT_01712 [Neisseria sicca ATCC 29256]|jgi:glycerol uptake facilitator|uniref:MIP family glycerol uptake facilitator protein GlpF n=2 Tax=Neisseria TaxID=482 RepID=A0AA36ULP6_9NEIS|nr:hypothetical protein NEISICOT_01712 [Neisseria sicca ATCC 29256]EGQ78424.1 MIP family glycerol uptake facilitator protein GlpF [Neisseria macacae ATCC 33926]